MNDSIVKGKKSKLINDSNIFISASSKNNNDDDDASRFFTYSNNFINFYLIY